jgi:hypothetical protein
MSNRRVLIQYGVGESLPLLALTNDRNREWAALLGYEFVVNTVPATNWYPHFERYAQALAVWGQNPDALIFHMDSDCVIVCNDDPATLLPDTKVIAMLWDNDVSIWRSGVMVVRGCPETRRCFEAVLAKGPPDPKGRPWDDEAAMMIAMANEGVTPYPLDARYNRIVRYVPDNIPADEAEVKIAAQHGKDYLIRNAFIGSWARDWKTYNPTRGDVGGVDGQAITWLMRAHADYDLCEKAIAKLRAVYPASDVMLVDDGTFDLKYDTLGAKYRLRVEHVEKMYDAITVGQMWHRDLVSYLGDAPSASRWLLKIDTDTLVVATMKRPFPTGKLFGALMIRYSHEFVQGGFIGMDRSTAQIIVDSGVMLSEVYNDKRWLLPSGNASEDLAISLGAVAAGVECVAHPEVGSAVLHPAK